MAAFDVLNRTESVHRHLLLEASAGTGKTFSIENIFVRLLTEPGNKEAPLAIENILVVTFTRMAVRELKERIHANLEKVLRLLKKTLAGENVKDLLPDYLAIHLENGEDAVLTIKKLIEKALFSFNQAQIFTIHGFCWRMLQNYSLEAGLSPDASSREDGSSSGAHRMQAVKDFLRRGINPSTFSPQQLKILMKKVREKSEKLCQDLLKEIDKEIDIDPPPAFDELFMHFQEAMRALKQDFGFESQKIMEDFLTLAPSYKGLLNKSKQVHPEKITKIKRFAVLFDQNNWYEEDFDGLIQDGLFLTEALSPENLTAKAKPLPREALHYPGLIAAVKDKLEKLISLAGNEAFLFARLASDCQKFMRSFQTQTEMFGHQDLLIQMQKAIEKPKFALSVRRDYHAAIIDEFQDTDPIQWKIFSALFASEDLFWNGYLHLVGDPKQSIYAFRQADIYTYLSAAERLGTHSHGSLDTNFRSNSTLIDALNLAFSSVFDPFSLPKLSLSLPYRNVLAGRKNHGEETLSDSPPALHFWQVSTNRSRSSLSHLETDFFFPAIAKEIFELHENHNVPFGQIAVLIADRHQGKRLSAYLHSLGIPVKRQKGIDLSKASAVDEMRDLLNGILHPNSKSSLYVALAGRLIGMTSSELQGLDVEETSKHLRIVQEFNRLKNLFVHSGFAAFLNHFMRTSWHSDGKSVKERLLNELEGADFYREWQDLSEIILEEEQNNHLLPQEIVHFLDDLAELADEDERKMKAYMDLSQEGVSIMTVHMSKGLEFDTVFTLALINRKKAEQDLIPVEQEGKLKLCPVESQQDPQFYQFCEESDAEKMRQLYVAFTRAKERLYVPFVIEENQKAIPIGSASPMDLFLAKLNKPQTDYPGVYERIALEDGSGLSEFVAKFPEKMCLSSLCKQPTLSFNHREVFQPQLTPPKEAKIPSFSQVIQSFTSLSRTHTPGISYGEEHAVPHDFLFDEKTEHTLPSGSDTGVVLHKIFELLSFDSVRDLKEEKAMLHLISPMLKGTPFALWENVIAKMVFKALTTSLGNENFCLADIDPKRVYREMEFLYPCEESHPMFQKNLAKPGYVKGVVDLFFEHQGKFYLLDWKSNWLGPSLDFYRPKYLEEAMKANQYDLQAAIYCQAFQKYLKIFDNRPFEEIFGGIYYLFVRGISPETGIVHFVA